MSRSLGAKIMSRVGRATTFLFGVEVRVRFYSPINSWRLLRDLKKYKEHADDQFKITTLFPCYTDSGEGAGNLDNHYFWQDSYVARLIHQQNPERHADVGSRLAGFIAHVASFREIEMFDIRPLNVDIPNVKFVEADIMKEDLMPANSLESLSCLHALEHFGLGRYGDPIDPQGHLKGFVNMTKILKPGGRFYLSVPMGVQRIEFHAHRIFSMAYLVEMVRSDYEIERFAYVNDQNAFFEDVDYHQGVKDNFGCKFGCAIFQLRKKIK